MNTQEYIDLRIAYIANCGELGRTAHTPEQASVIPVAQAAADALSKWEATHSPSDLKRAEAAYWNYRYPRPEALR